MKTTDFIEFELKDPENFTGGNMGFPLLPYYLTIASAKVKEFINDLIKPKN